MNKWGPDLLYSPRGPAKHSILAVPAASVRLSLKRCQPSGNSTGAPPALLHLIPEAPGSPRELLPRPRAPGPPLGGPRRFSSLDFSQRAPKRQGSDAELALGSQPLRHWAEGWTQETLLDAGPLQACLQEVSSLTPCGCRGHQSYRA